MSNIKRVLLYSIVVFILSLIYNSYTRFLVNGDEVNYLRYSSYIINNDAVITETTLSDLSIIESKPMIGYPLGTAICLGGFQLLTNANALESLVVVYSIINLCFYLVFRNFILLFRNNLQQSHELIVFLLCLPFPLILEYTYISDELSMLFFLSAVYYLCKYSWNNEVNNRRILLLSFISFLPGFFRYSFYSLGYSIPLGIAALWLLDGENKKYLKNAILVGLFLTCFNVVNTIFSKIITGTYYYLNNNYAYEKNGLYWENLLFIDLFPAKTFFDFDQVSSFFNSSILDLLIRLGSIIFSVILVYVVFRHFIGKRNNQKGVYRKFLIVNVVFIFSNLGMLITLSLKEPPQDHGTHLWSYIGETRYYSPTMFFLLIGVVLLIFTDKIKQVSRVILSVIICLSVLFSWALIFKKVKQVNKKGNILARSEKFLFLEDYAKNNQGFQLLYSDYSGSDMNLISSLGFKRVIRTKKRDGFQENMYPKVLKSENLKTSEPVIVVINLKLEEGNDFKKRFNPVEILKLPESSLYELRISPNI